MARLSLIRCVVQECFSSRGRKDYFTGVSLVQNLFRKPMDHSYEELRAAVLDLLAGREQASYGLSQFANLKISLADVLRARSTGIKSVNAQLSYNDGELFLELFWDLFRQGIITIGLNDANPDFPFFRVTSFGKKLLSGEQPYFFHDLSSYEKVIKDEVPDIDNTTLIYLKEAMQAFMSGCLLS